jgi:hypothetical protein
MKWLVVFSMVLSLALARESGVFEEIFDEINPKSSRCFVNINRDLGNPQPLYIRPGTEKFVHPLNRNGIIEMAANEEMELFCTNAFATPSDVESNLIRISCVSDTRFQHNGIIYNINQFTCRNWPTSVAQRRATITRCFNQGTLIDVGFQVNERFLHVYSACHDPKTEENYYTQDRLTPASAGQESNVARPSWRQGDFFPGKNVDNLHMRNVQRDTIATILGSADYAAEIIEEPNSNVFLARGHIAAMTDFISANEQRSTFFFINTAPQFHTFNSMNWVAVELSTRRLAADRNIFLDVYTGTFGRALFRDVFGIDRAIFLDHPNTQIPVPILFYKIIVNRADRTGVVLLGINNPHLSLSQIKRDFVICNDVSNRIDYISWRREDLVRGYGYACDVNDFLRKVPHVPGIDVQSLLV